MPKQTKEISYVDATLRLQWARASLSDTVTVAQKALDEINELVDLMRLSNDFPVSQSPQSHHAATESPPPTASSPC